MTANLIPKEDLGSVAVLPAFLRPFVLEDQLRIGSVFDGGYVLPERLLVNTNALISIGINLDWCFELDVLKRFPNTRIISFDYTTRLSYTLWWGISRFFYSPLSRQKRHAFAILKPLSYIKYISNPRVQHHPKFVGTEAGDNFATASEVFSNVTENESTLLKIDIEGAEYTVLDSLLQHHHNIAGLVIEFHEIPQNPQRFFDQIERLQLHYGISHVHVNNVAGVSQEGFPHFLEVTFIRRDFLSTESVFTGDQYILPQDTPNVPDFPCVRLVFAN